MSRSAPSLINPAGHFFSWAGSRGQLEWFDKSRGEKGETVQVKIPFEFLVLDELHTVTGYSDQDQSGFWSNEVRSTRDDFTVRTKHGVKYVGPYKNEQGIPQLPVGARYAKSVYIAHKIGEDWVIGNLKLSGAALTAWIDASKQGLKIAEAKIMLTGATEATKGTTKYFIPVFELTEPSDEEDGQAVLLDKALQIYLNQYLTAPKYDDNAEPVAEPGNATPEEIADFEERKAAQAKNAQPLTTDNLDDMFPNEPPVDDEPIDLKDIPF